MKAAALGLVLLVVGCAQEGAAPVTAEAPAPTVATVTTPVTPIPAEVDDPTTTPAAEPSIATTTAVSALPPPITGVEELAVPGSRPHDVAVAPDGTVWYTAQRSGSLDRLNPQTGEVVQVPLGPGAAPHGVIVGPEGAAWVTDQGLNALVRVDHDSLDLEVFAADVDVGMHTGVFAPDGALWFTGQRGYVGRLDTSSGEMDLFEAGGGPYGITAAPGGDIYFAALSGSYVGRVDPVDGEITHLDPPTAEQGARRVWADSAGAIWVSYWNTGHLARYDPGVDSWREWALPGEGPQAYAVYVDETDRPWVSDFGADHALLRFDPATEQFETVPLPTPGGGVRQLLGRQGEVWGAESAVDALIVVRFGD